MKREISNYPSYYITESGEVFHNEKKLKPFKCGAYKGVSLCKNGIIVKHYIHRLVAMMFLNKGLEFDLVVNHKNGDKNDNRVSNLEIVTQRENNLHAYRNKLHIPKIQSGENNYNAKLTYNDVLFIREHYRARSKEYSGKKLASMFGVSRTVITKVIKRKSWNKGTQELICE